MEKLESIEIQRDRCEKSRGVLRALTRIHVEIDAPARRVEAGEPEWVLRLRKVCLHVVAITGCDVDVDGVHVIAAELRAAYEQMSVIWKLLPDEYRFSEDGDFWSREARGGLARYNHPTMFSLAMPLSIGGFADAEDPRSFLQLAVWLGRLGIGYALAIGYLARVLGSEADIDARVSAVLADARL